jgi:hypothetical protein
MTCAHSKLPDVEPITVNPQAQVDFVAMFEDDQFVSERYQRLGTDAQLPAFEPNSAAKAKMLSEEARAQVSCAGVSHVVCRLCPKVAVKKAAAAASVALFTRKEGEAVVVVEDEDVRTCQRVMERTLANSPRFRIPLAEDKHGCHQLLCALLADDEVPHVTTATTMYLITGRGRDGEPSTQFPMGPLLASCVSSSPIAQTLTDHYYLQPASREYMDTLTTANGALCSLSPKYPPTVLDQFLQSVKEARAEVMGENEPTQA